MQKIKGVMGSVSIILKSTPKLKEDELILTNMFNLVGSTTA